MTTGSPSSIVSTIADDVDVVLAAVGLPGPDGSGRKHLFDLAAGQPPRHVEVVDVQIAEDPAAGRDVPLVGRLVVVSTHPQRVQGPGVARGDEFPRCAKAGIEPSHERYLQFHAGLPDDLDRRLRVVDVDRDRLLAEHRQPPLRSSRHVPGVFCGGGGDHQRIEPCIQDLVDGPAAPADDVAEFAGTLGVMASDEDLLDLRVLS